MKDIEILGKSPKLYSFQLERLSEVHNGVLGIVDTKTQQIIYSPQFNGSWIQTLPRHHTIFKGSSEANAVGRIFKLSYTKWAENNGIEKYGTLIAKNINLQSEKNRTSQYIHLLYRERERLVRYNISIEGPDGIRINNSIQEAKTKLEALNVLTPDEMKISQRGYWGTKTATKRFFNICMNQIINDLDPHVLKVCRRYPGPLRGLMLEFALSNERYLQLCESFPYLAFSLATGKSYPSEIIKGLKLEVNRGTKLKQICKDYNIPYSFRKIKPRCCLVASNNSGLIHSLARSRPEIFRSYLPEKTMEQYRWFLIVFETHISSQQYITWLSKNINPIINNKLYDIRGTLIQIYDAWRDEPWNESVKLEGALRRSLDWHERLQARQREERRKLTEEQERIKKMPFPEPWFEGVVDEESGYEIKPILNQKELEDEGDEMHHCVGTYADRVKTNICFIYSVLKNGKRIGTFELQKEDYGSWTKGSRATLIQFRGPCNEVPPEEARQFVNSWLGSKNPKPPSYPINWTITNTTSTNIIIPQNIIYYANIG